MCSRALCNWRPGRGTEPRSGLPLSLVCPGMVNSAASTGRLPPGLPLEPDSCVSYPLCHGSLRCPWSWAATGLQPCRAPVLELVLGLILWGRHRQVKQFPSPSAHPPGWSPSQLPPVRHAVHLYSALCLNVLFEPQNGAAGRPCKACKLHFRDGRLRLPEMHPDV